MVTTDRAAGSALVVIGLIAVWESRRFPLGSLHRPGPAYMPTLLALLLIIFGIGVALLGSRSQRLSEVGWHEWRHAVGIFAACAFSACSPASARSPASACCCPPPSASTPPARS